MHPSVCHSNKKNIPDKCLSLNTTAESAATQEEKERKQPGKSLHQNIISIFSVSSFFASAKHSTQTETKGAEASLQRGTRWQQLKGRGFNIPGRSPGAAPLVIKSSRVSQPLQPLGLPRSRAGTRPASQPVSQPAGRPVGLSVATLTEEEIRPSLLPSGRRRSAESACPPRSDAGITLQSEGRRHEAPSRRLQTARMMGSKYRIIRLQEMLLNGRLSCLSDLLLAS